MTEALADAVERLARDDAARFVHLRARGRVFCLGREREGSTPDELRAEAARIVRLLETMRRSPLVVLCEVGGDAAGFGAGLAAAADIAVSADDAHFSFPELEAGLAPTIVLSWLAELAHPKRAFELVATGRRFDAREAAALGLVTEVVPRADTGTRTRAWIDALAARSAPALRDMKSFIARTRESGAAATAHAAVDALALGSLRLQVSLTPRACGGGATPSASP